MNLRLNEARALTRRQFFAHSGLSLGALALGNLLAREGGADTSAPGPAASRPLAPKAPPLPARAKSVIYLHMSGAPPSLDLFDWKPKLAELNMKPCPEARGDCPGYTSAGAYSYALETLSGDLPGGALSSCN